uniref:lipoprotein N-acyltransferase Lnb domain-containing protein n=1 Tax=Gelidibacter sp. TaxID=2018083 RepID=UPI00404B1856
MKLKITLFFFFTFNVALIGQSLQLSQFAEISVLTVGPGASLNDAFGHSGFRVKDSMFKMDIVFGYGQYDFDTPNFYLKFAQGKLNYLMSVHEYQDFYDSYVYYNRTIDEQVLNLSAEQKQALFNQLANNYQPENRAYLYDFFYDNCATRIRDMVEDTSQPKVAFTTPAGFEPKTFRALIHEHVNRNSWGSFGIDLALGSIIDQQATAEEHMFLPKYIHEFFANATIGNKPLVRTSSVIFKQKETKSSANFLFSPLMVFGIIGAFIIFITYSDYKKNTRSKWLDVSLFSITGLIGIMLLLLWFATDHTATANNYNLLWAFPLNLLVIGQLLRPQVKNWVKRYLRFLMIMLALLTFHWITGVQVFAIGLIPLLIALAVRYLFLVRFFKTV